MITGKTQLLGVIGYPIQHSLSPVMHNAAIQALIRSDSANRETLDFVYLPFAVEPSNLAQAIAGFQAIGLQGFSVTIPHKQTILSYLTEVSTIAQAVGAVNTVYRTEQGWGGTNTDVAGFLAPLKHQSQDWSQTTVVVLGNGGAARAVVAGCTQLGCQQIQVIGRDPAKLKAFEQSWQHSLLPVSLSVHPWSDLPDLLPQTGLLVNTTPIGMHPHQDACPLAPAEMQAIAPGTLVYDLIYTPNPTRFLKEAQAQGAIAIDGLEMLVQQGAVALELWLKHPVPVEVMRQSLIQHLGL